MISIMTIPEPFNTLPASALSSITLARTALAFRQGDRTTGILWVREGLLEMSRYSADGHQIVLHRAGPGESLAEASLFADHYHCSCMALEDSVILRLDKAAILAQIGADPAFATKLVRRLSLQVQEYRRRIEIGGIRGAQARVFAAMAEFGQEGSVINFAGRIGLSHEATYRALSALSRQGLIRKVGRGRYVAGQ